MSLEVDIKKKFKGFCLDVNFKTEDHSLGILGASGCGKSMTLKCIAGIEKPDEGRIVLDGKVLFDARQKINLPPDGLLPVQLIVGLLLGVRGLAADLIEL